MAVSIKKAKRVRPDRGPGAEVVRLASIAVRGVRAFDTLDLAPHSAEDRGQWIVVLGDNGVGKTSLLRSIALPLLDPHVAIRSAMDVDAAATFFRPTSGPPLHPDEPTSVGSAVRIATETAAREYFRRLDLGVHTHGEPKGSRPLDVFGYGSRRGDALGGRDRDVQLEAHRAVGTLFDKDARLIHAETWLRREKLRAVASGKFLSAVLETVAALLPGGESIVFDTDEALIADPSGRRYPLAAMSDGYLSTIGWAIDLIARWAERYRDTGKLDQNFAQDMPCVVLIDELDQHLHPRWQLDIISRLRAAFPKTTFIVTTHNPLTLQGTRPGEVFVLQKHPATGQIGIVQRDVPPGSDANRLLTGDWFGLGSTLDESTLQKLDRHRELLLARRPEPDPERRALEQELRTRLHGFADTSYERIAQDVIAQLHDEKMRRRQDITDEDRERVVREVRARLAQLEKPTSGAGEPTPSYLAKGAARPARATPGRASRNVRSKVAIKAPTRPRPKAKAPTRAKRR